MALGMVPRPSHVTLEAHIWGFLSTVILWGVCPSNMQSEFGLESGADTTMFVLRGRQAALHNLLGCFFGWCQSVGGMLWSGGGSEGPTIPATTTGQLPVGSCHVTPADFACGWRFFQFCVYVLWMLAGCSVCHRRSERNIPVCACHLSSRFDAGLVVCSATFLRGCGRSGVYHG